jgi:hypothetical protein
MVRIDQDRWTNLRLQGVDDIAVQGSRVVNLFVNFRNSTVNISR